MCAPNVGNNSMDCSGLSTLNNSREQFKTRAHHLERNCQVSLKSRAWADHLTSPVGFKSGTIKNKMSKKQVVIVLDDDEEEEENVEIKASDDTVHISSKEDNICNNVGSKMSSSLNLDKVLSMKADKGKSSNEINDNYSKDFNDWFNKKLTSAPWFNKKINSAPPGKKGAFVLASVNVPDNATGRSVLDNCLLTPTSQNFNTGGNFSSLVNQSNTSNGSPSINLTSSHRSQKFLIIGNKLSQGGEHSKDNFMANETVRSSPSFNQVQDSLLIKSLLTNTSSSVNMLDSRPFLNAHNAVANMTVQQPVLPRPIAINLQIPASSNDRVAILEVPAPTSNSPSGFQPLDSVGGHRLVIVPSTNNQSNGNLVLNPPSNALVQQPQAISSIAGNSNTSSQIFVVQSMAETSRPSPILNPSLNTPYSNLFKSSLKSNFSNILNSSIPERKTINNLANSYSVAPNSIQISSGYNEIHCKVVSNISTSTANVHVGPTRESNIQCGSNIQGLDSNRVTNNQSGPLTPSFPFQSTRGTPVGISFNPVTSQAELVFITDAGGMSSSLLSSQSCQTVSNQTTRISSQTDTLVASKLLKALESGVLKPLCNIDSSKISWKVVDKNNSDEKSDVKADNNVVVIDDSSDEEKNRHESLAQLSTRISNSIQDSSSSKISNNRPKLRSTSVTKYFPIKPKTVPDTVSNESAVSNDKLSNISNANDQTRNTVITKCSKLEPHLSMNDSDPTLSKLNYFKEENQCNEESTPFGHRHKRTKLCLQEDTSSQDKLNMKVDSNLIPDTVKQEINTIKLDGDDIKDDSENDHDHSLDQTNLEVEYDVIPNAFKEELPTTKLDYDNIKVKSKDNDDFYNVKSEDLKNNPNCSNIFNESGTVGSWDNGNHGQEDSSCVDVKPFACSYCGFRVAIESNLEMHVKAFHIGKKAKSMPILKKNNDPSKKINALVIKTQMFRCFVCDYCTYRSSNFNLHLMSEHDIYSCNKCSFMVDNSDELRVHETIHKKGGKIPSKLSVEVEKEGSNNLNDSQEPSFEIKCESCDFKTPSQSKMIAHTLTSHFDQNDVKAVKVYKCEKCVHEFTKESDMFRHQKMAHTDRCRFPCDSCGFRASSQESLVKHKKQIHPMRDPLSCCYCNFTTDNHAKLRDHKHISHPSKYPFACEKCDFRTSKSSILDRHLKMYHSTNSNEPSSLTEYMKINFGV